MHQREGENQEKKGPQRAAFKRVCALREMWGLVVRKYVGGVESQKKKKETLRAMKKGIHVQCVTGKVFGERKRWPLEDVKIT